MKCPHCGKWNQPSMRHCFYCGVPLTAQNAEPEWKQKFVHSRKRSVHTVYDDTVTEIDAATGKAPDPTEQESTLADRMHSMKERRARGLQQQEALRRRFSAASPRNQSPESPLPENDFDLPPMPNEHTALRPPEKKSRRVRLRMRLVTYPVVLLALLMIGYLVYTMISEKAEKSVPPVQYNLEASEVDGYAAHHVEIFAEEGSQVYIAELMHTYVAVDGKAVIDVPDYTFYDDIENFAEPTLDVSLTPTVIYGGKEQTLGTISYTIDVPLSLIEMISPESTYEEVSTSIYGLEFFVAPNSRVYVNGVDISDTVDEDGRVTYNPAIRAIGENIVAITVHAPHCRENNMSLTFFRAPMDIELELSADTLLSTSSNYMGITATTEPGATVTIESPYANLDVSQVDSTGVFTFDAAMQKVGYNTIVIRSSKPGREDSVLEHRVYYLPPPATYTPKAWALGRNDYNELLNNISMRVEHAQIYLCLGEIVEIRAQSPQIAIMDTTSDGQEQLVMLENQSATEWVIGQRYKVFADVCGLYNGIPRMIARYTYSE